MSGAALSYVIRGIGERTEKLCTQIVERQRGEGESLLVLREPTHADAIEKTLEAVAARSAPWVAAIDADMLVYPDGVATMRAALAGSLADRGIVHFAVQDKLYRMKRWGVTVYRSDIGEKALAVLRALRRDRNLKIERAMIKELENGGTKVEFSRADVALHDFYQYYADLYRKAYLNTVRNPGANERAMKQWGRLAHADDDYRVMLKGLRDALEGKKGLTNSVRDFDREDIAGILDSLGMAEKQPLGPGDFDGEDMESVIKREIRSLKSRKVFNDFFERDFTDRLARMIRRRASILFRSGHHARGS